MSRSVLITNANIWQWTTYPSKENGFTPLGSAQFGSILIMDGIIQDIIYGNDSPNPSSFETVIDAKKSFILPGLMDSHIHVGSLGESQHYVNLSECETIDQLKGKVKEAHLKEETLPFIVGFNWDQEKLGRFPCAEDLESLGIEKPIFLWRACWHIAVTNKRALQLAGCVDQNGKVLMKDVEGGAIDVNEYDVATGIVRERAVEPILAAFSAYKSYEQSLQFVKEGLALCLQNGLTSVETNDAGCYSCYEKLNQENSLPVRVFLTPNYHELDELTKVIGGPVPLSSTKQKLAVERVKIFSDGSLGAETAALKESDISYKGILIHTKESLQEMITDSSKRGFRVEIHAIGDAAAEQVLNAMEDSVKQKCAPLFRPILTHCQVLSSHAIDLMVRYDVIANVQPSFVPTDMRWVENRLTKDKFPFAYAWKTLIQRGIHVAGGSDAPIEHPSPLRGIFDAMYRSNVRRKKESEQEVVFRHEECLSLSEAIWMYTKEGAFASGYEDVLGEIKSGFAADLVFLNASVLADPHHFHDLSPLMVIVEGKIEFCGKDAQSFFIKTEAAPPLPPNLSYQSNVKSDAPHIQGKGGYFDLNQYCSEVVSIGYCSCKFHWGR